MPEFFEKFIFELEGFSYIRMGLSLPKHLVSPLFVLYFDFWVCCLYTFNPLPSLLEWVSTLITATYRRNMQSRQFCRTTYMMRIKESERGPFFLIFRWNIVLQDSYQADEIVIEIEEWKQVPGICVKSFSRALLRVLETSLVS